MFLGYEKAGDKIVIVPDEAEIVREIYKSFLVYGKTPTGIAKELKERGIKTPSKKSTNWTKNNITSILQNEKYKGDALLQKTFTDNFLEQTIIKNTGQIPQYYVEKSHPAIIDKDMWELVQIEIKRRDNLGAKYSSSDIFSSKLICGNCGGFYGKKKWHSISKYSRFVYQCNSKYNMNHEKCRTPALTEDLIKEKFVIAYNQVMKDKERIVEDINDVIRLLSDTSELDAKIIELQNKMEVISGLIDKLIKENTRTVQDQARFASKYEELSVQYEIDKNA